MPAHAMDRMNDEPGRGLIPGAYEPGTRALRQQGAMGGPAYGSDGIPGGSSTMAAATVAERKKEGGGGQPRRKP